MPTNFELKRLKPKLDIVEKPENRVHKLTDSNVSRAGRLIEECLNYIFVLQVSKYRRLIVMNAKSSII